MSDVVFSLLLLVVPGPVGAGAHERRGKKVEDALLIKVPEAAVLLGVSRAKLYELMALGAVPSVKVGGCRRFRIADLRDYVAGLPTA